MPWNSSYNDNMQGACKEIPGDARQDQGYSTPDVYGRAVQFYLALERAAQKQDFTSEAVIMWRALLSMLALRNMLDLPLKWDYVQISSGDPLSNALSYPPKDANQILYPGRAEYQWDGQTFYTLSWAPEGQNPVELAIYSPMTLIYPVADWRKIFANIPQLNKFFKAGAFQGHLDSLQGGELNFVYPWLRDMRDHLNGEAGKSDAKRNIILHLEQYMSELEKRDNSLVAKKLPLKPEKFGYTALLNNLVPQLLTAYDIGGPVFSEQMCVFHVDASEGNPFEPCQYSDNYKILGGPLENGVSLYAFLPIHPGRREECKTNGIAESITMRLKTEKEGAELKHYIHVSASTTDLPGIRMEKDYLLVEGESVEKNVAVYYKDDYNRDVILNKDVWPLFSVWPTTLDAKWSQYYIMRSSYADALRVNGERGTPGFTQDGSVVEMGDNHWVVKTSYVPDAIPVVRMARDEDGRLTDQGLTVGMLTPDSGASVKPTGKAIVAVDFGTSSTRVFYSLAGNNQPVREILVVQDKPLEVTRYEDSVSRQLEMSTYFISPGDRHQEDDTLFSIFRRSEDKNRDKVRPLLDGAIYQPRGWVDPNATQNLVTDLKWNGAQARPYYIAFMQQLCLHIMTYLHKKYQVAQIEWHYALPRVMDQTNQKAMNSIWQNEVLTFLNDVSANTILHMITAPSSADLPLLTESIAASRYFDRYRSNEILPPKGYLVVDVGGGSTDVALWQKSGPRPTELKWHSSVRVAGRKMFTKWVEQYINNLAAGINDQETASLLRTINEGDFSKHPDTGAREALVDRLLTTDSDTLLTNYKTNITTQANDWGSALRDKITQAVTLLMFSLGYQIGVLMRDPNAEDEKTQPNEPTEPKEPAEPKEKNQKKQPRCKIPAGPGYFTIAFAGRGSNVLKWLECGDIVLSNFFKAGVSAAGATWPKVDIHLLTSDDPKCEVALGLLVSTPPGSPTGWEDVGNKELMKDQYYYADEFSEEDFDENGAPVVTKKGAATAFYEEFKRNFPGNFNIKNLSDSSSQNKLANVAIRTVGMKAYVDDVFKVLLESIYDVLEA